MTTPLLLDSFADVDTLATPPTVVVKGSALRGGMVLVDELGCPCAGLDHKVRGTRNSGSVAFLTHDLDRGSLGQEHFHRNATFTVVAK